MNQKNAHYSTLNSLKVKISSEPYSLKHRLFFRTTEVNACEYGYQSRSSESLLYVSQQNVNTNCLSSNQQNVQPCYKDNLYDVDAYQTIQPVQPFPSTQPPDYNSKSSESTFSKRIHRVNEPSQFFVKLDLPEFEQIIRQVYQIEKCRHSQSRPIHKTLAGI